MSRLNPTALALALVATVVGCVAPVPPASAVVTLEGRISSVVDGDTVKVISRGFETTVRLIGIDSPETRDPRRPVQCHGPEATARARSLMPIGARVRLTTDDTQDTRDRYGRLLAYVHRAGRAESVNRVMVRTGAARVYVHDGVRFAHAGSFFRAQNRVRRAGKGLWGPPCRGNTSRPAPRPAVRAGAVCDPAYEGTCVPIVARDLNCDDIRARVRVVGVDRHRFDLDGDGWGCEGYA